MHRHGVLQHAPMSKARAPKVRVRARARARVMS